MDIEVVDLEGCATASGAVVVIDVLRAFTTCAFAFAAGAREIWPVATVEEAFAARRDDPRLLVMGEVEGLPVEGFDLDNSPAGLAAVDLEGRTLVHRSTAGTQGLVRSRRADLLIAASFVTATATVRLLQRERPDRVTFVATGRDAWRDGDEDFACADFLAALLRGEQPDVDAHLDRIETSTAGLPFVDPDDDRYPAADLRYARAVDAYAHPLVARRRDGRLVLAPEPL